MPKGKHKKAKKQAPKQARLNNAAHTSGSVAATGAAAAPDASTHAHAHSHAIASNAPPLSIHTGALTAAAAAQVMEAAIKDAAAAAAPDPASGVSEPAAGLTLESTPSPEKKGLNASGVAQVSGCKMGSKGESVAAAGERAVATSAAEAAVTLSSSSSLQQLPPFSQSALTLLQKLWQILEQNVCWTIGLPISNLVPQVADCQRRRGNILTLLAAFTAGPVHQLLRWRLREVELALVEAEEAIQMSDEATTNVLEHARARLSKMTSVGLSPSGQVVSAIELFRDLCFGFFSERIPKDQAEQQQRWESQACSLLEQQAASLTADQIRSNLNIALVVKPSTMQRLLQFAGCACEIQFSPGCPHLSQLAVEPKDHVILCTPLLCFFPYGLDPTEVSDAFPRSALQLAREYVQAHPLHAGSSLDSLESWVAHTAEQLDTIQIWAAQQIAATWRMELKRRAGLHARFMHELVWAWRAHSSKVRRLLLDAAPDQLIPDLANICAEYLDLDASAQLADRHRQMHSPSTKHKGLVSRFNSFSYACSCGCEPDSAAVAAPKSIASPAKRADATAAASATKPAGEISPIKACNEKAGLIRSRTLVLAIVSKAAAVDAPRAAGISGSQESALSPAGLVSREVADGSKTDVESTRVQELKSIDKQSGL